MSANTATFAIQNGRVSVRSVEFGIPWFKFPKVTTIARLLCTQELRAIQGSPFLPVNDPCDDDGSTRATNPNEELNMSKNVGENFVQNYNIVLEDSE